MFQISFMFESIEFFLENLYYIFHLREYTKKHIYMYIHFMTFLAPRKLQDTYISGHFRTLTYRITCKVDNISLVWKTPCSKRHLSVQFCRVTKCRVTVTGIVLHSKTLSAIFFSNRSKN